MRREYLRRREELTESVRGRVLSVAWMPQILTQKAWFCVTLCRVWQNGQQSAPFLVFDLESRTIVHGQVLTVVLQTLSESAEEVSYIAMVRSCSVGVVPVRF
jgi:hypothetical protein